VPVPLLAEPFQLPLSSPYGGPRLLLFVVLAINVQRPQESTSEREARLISMPQGAGRQLPHPQLRYPVDVGKACALVTVTLYYSFTDFRRVIHHDDRRSPSLLGALS
jgi:hypothetical protein